MKWFNNPTTAEELKKEYKRLVFKHHPDKGGKTEDMQEINAEYDALFARLKDTHKNANGETYTAKEQTTETPAEFREILEKLIHLDGIEIEICGSWIWITGNTFNNKETLCKLGFKYSRNKKAWYFHKDGYHKRSKKTYSLNQIREMWGSEKVEAEQQDKLAPAYA